MGLRRIRRQMNKVPIPRGVVPTNFFWNNIEVCLLIPKNLPTEEAIEDFKGYMRYMHERAFIPNQHDMFQLHIAMAEKMRNGEVLIEAKGN